MGLNLDRLMAAPGNAGYEVDLALFSAYKISQIYLFQKMIYGPFLGGSRAATARGGSPGPRAQRVRLILFVCLSVCLSVSACLSSLSHSLPPSHYLSLSLSPSLYLSPSLPPSLSLSRARARARVWAQRVRLIRVRARPSRNVWAPGVALPKEERDLIVLPRFAAIRSPPARANDPIGSPARFSRARAKAGKQVRPTVCRAVGARLCFGFV